MKEQILKSIQFHKSEIHRYEKKLEEINKPKSKEANRLSPNKFQKETELLKKMLGNLYNKVISNNRKYEIASLRQVAMHYFCENSNLKLKEIGVIFGYRHYSVVIHSRDRVKNLRETDNYIQDAIRFIDNNLNKKL